MHLKSYPDGFVAPAEARGDVVNTVSGRITGRSSWFASLLLAITFLASSSARAYEAPPSSFFPVGVFLQPTFMFDTWKARGVNTVVDYWGDQAALEEWNAGAVSRGLYMIRGPRTNLSKDVNEKNLIAWSHRDEPDYNGVSPTQIAADYALMKAADPKRPVYLNLAGGLVVNPYNYSSINYPAYLKASDWVANDMYPISAWNHPEWIDFSKPLNPKDPYNPTPTVRLNSGTIIDMLRTMSGGKKQFAYIETSFQETGGPTAGVRGVTAAEFRGEVWDAIIHGAKGIVYFPQKVGTTFMHDATPADVAAEMTKQDALIAKLGAVINTGNDATDNRVAFSNSNLEGTWRTLDGKQYLFVLNMSTQTLNNLTFTTAGLDKLQTLQVFDELRSETIQGASITDTFNPYQLHVYVADGPVVGSPVVVGAAVPEPTGSAILMAMAACGLLRRRRAAN